MFYECAPNHTHVYVFLLCELQLFRAMMCFSLIITHVWHREQQLARPPFL